MRREKTTHKRSMRARVALLVVHAPVATCAAVEAAAGDITDAGGVDELVVAEGDVAHASRCGSPTTRTVPPASDLGTEVGARPLGADVGGLALLDQLAVDHDGGLVGERERGLDELLDHDDGQPLGRDQLADDLVELLDDDRRQAHGELVEQQDLGVGGQRPGHGSIRCSPPDSVPASCLRRPASTGEPLEGPLLDPGSS